MVEPARPPRHRAGGSRRPVAVAAAGVTAAVVTGGSRSSASRVYQVRLVDDRGHTATVTVPLSAGATVPTGARLN